MAAIGVETSEGLDPAVDRGEKAKSGDQWKIFGLDRRFKWCPVGIGRRKDSVPYVH